MPIETPPPAAIIIEISEDGSYFNIYDILSDIEYTEPANSFSSNGDILILGKYIYEKLGATVNGYKMAHFFINHF